MEQGEDLSNGPPLRGKGMVLACYNRIVATYYNGHNDYCIMEPLTCYDY